jgi:hypothetical protein
MPDFPILDRKPHFDNESRNYAIRKLLGEPIEKHQRIWAPRAEGPLDQGKEGRCVAFGWAGELAATPQVYKLNDDWVNKVSWPLVQSADRKGICSCWCKGYARLEQDPLLRMGVWTQ